MSYAPNGFRAADSIPTLRFEPIRDAASGEVVGREALWGEIHQRTLEYVDRWALRTATACARTVNEAELQTPIHIDVRAITDADEARDLNRWLQRLDLGRQNVALEVDAALALARPETVTPFAQAVRRLGFEIVLDHVRDSNGLRGHPALDHCGAIKIDATAIAAASQTMAAADNVREIVATAHAAGLYAIACGVLDSRTWQAVRELGCDRVQRIVKPAI
jgi:EAL domain-containing protein (putative c-di-GMP-specific phosphodiesterase class I)